MTRATSATRRIRVGSPAAARLLEIGAAGIRTVAIEVTDGRHVATGGDELALVLDTARWRRDIESWRHRTSDADGTLEGFHHHDIDDASWVEVPHLHPDYHPSFRGHAWFRTRVEIPEEFRGEPITLGLGGMDDEDWLAYRVFLNAIEIDAWETGKGWREAHQIRIDPNDPRYNLMRFDRANLIVVEARDLDRPTDGVSEDEAEHLFYHGWLLDQYVAVGEPFARLAAHEVTDVREAGDGSLEVDVTMLGQGGLAATIAYTAVGELLRKQVTIRNDGNEVARVLDVVIDDLRHDDAETSRGGRGQPVFSADLFLGVEHAGGLAQGTPDSVRLVELIGSDVTPSSELECAPSVIGAKGAATSIDAAFRRYVLGLRPRREDRLVVYSALGWYDYTNPADPLPVLTEALLDENLAVLSELGHHGVDFDVYMLDDWWDPSDFSRFRPDTFPSGGEAIGQRLAAHGLRFGMWNATTRAVWTAEHAPGLDASIAGGVARTSDVARPADEHGQWFWDEEFAFLANGEKRFCLASEPMRGYLVGSVEKHARELELGVLKLDCATPHCTSSDHDHRAGKYSVRPMIDTIAQVAAAARRGSPDVAVMWYWGWRSPWMLAHGDIMFDKGLKLEAASPASIPAPTFRQGVTLNIDQSTRFGRAIPLPLQDSLGVWIGHVAWANRMGREGWRDAFLLDIARGASIVSFWGDVSLFDAEDVEFLRRGLRHLRRTSPGHLETYEVGGDPWKCESYGYAQPMLGGGKVTVHNPTFQATTVGVDLGPLGLNRGGAFALREAYPVPGVLEDEIDPLRALELELRPWEVRSVEILDRHAVEGQARSERRNGPDSRTLDISSLVRETAHDGQLIMRGAVRLPDLHRHDSLFVLVRLHRDGVWWYHPAPQELLEFRARLNGPAVEHSTSPTTRSRNGPGCPWVSYTIPAGEAWSGEELEISMRAQLPEGVDIVVDAVACSAWWQAQPARFDPS
jgi:hypothetical protein